MVSLALPASGTKSYRAGVYGLAVALISDHPNRPATARRDRLPGGKGDHEGRARRA